MESPRSINQAVEETLLSLPKFGSGVGLHRMLALCAPLLASDWMRQLDAIKVTGSNGKGSVCAMIAAIAHELGLSCGLYISPHLISFDERIVVNGEKIQESEIAKAAEWIMRRRDEYQEQFPDDTVGAFECFTGMALYHFAEKRPAVVVAEAGIGGRYDSTRIIPGRVAVLTSLDLEHTSVLGSTLELISYDKADLCPEGGTLVTGPLTFDILRRLQAYCRIRNVELRRADERSLVRRVAYGETFMEVDLAVDELDLPGLQMALQGHHQVNNLTVAIVSLQEWLRVHNPQLLSGPLETAVRRAMISLRWPGRFERVATNPDVFIDVGHTPEAISSLVNTVRAALAGKRILLVTGVSYDKEVEGIVNGLLPVADAVVCTRAYHKGSQTERIHGIVKSSRPDLHAFQAATIEQAMQRAREYAAEENMIILVAGGLFLSIEAMCALRGRDPQSLRFF